MKDEAELKQFTVDLMVNCQRFTRLATRQSGTQVPHALLRVLAHLDQTGPIGVSRLAVVDRCSQPTMTQIVNRMESRKWVERRPDPSDARVVHVSISPLGSQVLNEGRRNAAARLLPDFLALSEAEHEDLVAGLAVLKRLVDNAPLG